MKLHEAIEKLLIETRRPMTTTEIAEKLNQNKWYTRQDNGPITALQIHGRTRNYPHLFLRDKSIVTLNNHEYMKPKNEIIEIAIQSDNQTEIIRVLLEHNNFKKVSDIKNEIPEEPGIYCIKIIDNQSLPFPFNEIVIKNNQNYLYIGIANRNLKKRLLRNELRGEGHGTFFRSLGAILGFKPPKGSLVGKVNSYNYKFSSEDQGLIVSWIDNNLLVNWIELKEGLKQTEALLIETIKPLLNISHNKFVNEEFSKLRSECINIANEPIN